MPIATLAEAAQVLADHNLFIEGISNAQWDRFVDASSVETLEAIAEALFFIGAHTRNVRLTRMAVDATSVAKILVRYRKR